MSLYPKSHKECLDLLNKHIELGKVYTFETDWTINDFNVLKARAVGRMKAGEPWIRTGPVDETFEYEVDNVNYIRIPVISTVRLFLGAVWISPSNSEWFVTKIKPYT